jgi:hypothetical protein
MSPCVSTQFDPTKITLGEDSRLRVRSDVDETNVAHLKLGPPGIVTVEACGTHGPTGHALRGGPDPCREEWPIG